MEDLKAEVEQLKRRIEIMEEENHELRQMFIRHIVTAYPTLMTPTDDSPKPWCSDHYNTTAGYHHY